MKFLKLWDLSGYSERTRDLLAKNEHFLQIVSEIVAHGQFVWGRPKKN